MYNRGQLITGAMLVLLGLVFLIGTLFQIDVWALCWPIGLILVGVWLVVRPNLSGPGKGTDVVLLGEVRRRGPWVVRNEEIWLGVADVDMDFSHAAFPPGETKVNIYGFVGDVDIFVPRSIGVAVRVNGVIIDSELLGHEMDAFLAPVEATSTNYLTVEQKLCIEMWAFVADIKVRHI